MRTVPARWPSVAREPFAAKFPQIDVTAITYFAASMFWRASVHHWKNYTGERIDLGPYEEEFRKYLMEKTDFPQNCALWVSVPDNMTAFTPSTFVPYGGRITGGRIYKLIVLGVGFHLHVGKGLVKEYYEPCFVRGTGHPIIKTDLLEEGIITDVLQHFTLNPDLL